MIIPCFAGSRHLMPEMTLVEPRGVSSNGEAWKDQCTVTVPHCLRQLYDNAACYDT
jgi:hypothetical protein